MYHNFSYFGKYENDKIHQETFFLENIPEGILELMD